MKDISCHLIYSLIFKKDKDLNIFVYGERYRNKTDTKSVHNIRLYHTYENLLKKEHGSTALKLVL